MSRRNDRYVRLNWPSPVGDRNVQSDWTEDNKYSDAYIKNKNKGGTGFTDGGGVLLESNPLEGVIGQDTWLEIGSIILEPAPDVDNSYETLMDMDISVAMPYDTTAEGDDSFVAPLSIKAYAVMSVIPAGAGLTYRYNLFGSVKYNPAFGISAPNFDKIMKYTVNTNDDGLVMTVYVKNIIPNAKRYMCLLKAPSQYEGANTISVWYEGNPNDVGPSGYMPQYKEDLLPVEPTGSPQGYMVNSNNLSTGLVFGSEDGTAYGYYLNNIDRASVSKGDIGANAVDLSFASGSRPGGAIEDYSFASGLDVEASGYGAHAEGVGTSARGEWSHAEGSGSTASGGYSHSEGLNTEASQSSSHAEGNTTKAFGPASHAEGNNTTASGADSHAEGINTVASGADSHAEGTNTKAIGEASHSEGAGTEANGSYSHAEGNATKAHGLNSHAEGLSAVATGSGSHAEGRQTISAGENSHAEGYLCYTNITDGATPLTNPPTSPAPITGQKHFILPGATGAWSGQDGKIATWNGSAWVFSDITSKYAHAEGIGTKAIGEASHAEGTGAQAAGHYSHAEGMSSEANGYVSHAEGEGSVANGQRSHAEGYSTTTEGEASHAEGWDTTASGTGSHAEGRLTVASGSYSHAEGYQTKANGNSSHAEGYQTKADGVYAHAEGELTISAGVNAHAEGNTTVAGGASSHAEGVNVVAGEGDQGSHVEGSGNASIGAYSHIEGYNNSFRDDTTDFRGLWDPTTNTPTLADGSGTTGHTYFASRSGNHQFDHGFEYFESGDSVIYIGGDWVKRARLEALNNGGHVEGIYADLDGLTNWVSVIGCGTGYGTGRKNAQVVWTDGTVSLPTSTIALIDSRGDKAVTTVEYVNGKITDVNGLVIGNESGDTGYWLSGDNRNFKGDIGLKAVDLSTNSSASTTHGATGSHSHAEGYQTTAQGLESHAEGWNTTASGTASHAEGKDTTASNQQSHAEGSGTIASNYQSHAEGLGTTASGQQSHAEGDGTIAFGNQSHAEGLDTTASGHQSHAEGSGTAASGTYSHAEGVNTIASGLTSHAEGNQTSATSTGAHAEGYVTIASGQYSHAEGNGNIASGSNSHAEGASVIAAGGDSHAEGALTITNGYQSHVEGRFQATYYDQQHVEGFYNTIPTVIESIISVQGWNASTNTPPLSNGTPPVPSTGNPGYRVQVAGSVSFGGVAITFLLGDYVYWNGSAWVKAVGKSGALQNQALHVEGKYADLHSLGTDVISVIGIGSDLDDKKNGRVMYTDGTMTLPEVTTAEITTRGNKAITTKEYVDDTIAGAVITDTYRCRLVSTGGDTSQWVQAKFKKMYNIVHVYIPSLTIVLGVSTNQQLTLEWDYGAPAVLPTYLRPEVFIPVNCLLYKSDTPSRHVATLTISPVDGNGLISYLSGVTITSLFTANSTITLFGSTDGSTTAGIQMAYFTD